MSSDLKTRLQYTAEHGLIKAANDGKHASYAEALARITKLEDALRALLEDSEGCYPTQTVLNRARKALGDKP